MPSKIELTLRGLVLIFIKRDQFIVGFLRQAPHDHKFEIKIERQVDHRDEYEIILELEAPQIKRELTLKVTNNKRISCRKNNVVIDRLTDPQGTPDQDSCLWIVDFEKDIHKKLVGSTRAAFISLLSINDGELFTQMTSVNELIMKRRDEAQWTRFGFVATEMGIEILLDQSSGSALFANGSDTVSLDPQFNYRMTFDRGPSGIPIHGGHADFYYTAIGHLLSEGEKMNFASLGRLSSADHPEVTPDAACFPGGGGTGGP